MIWTILAFILVALTKYLTTLRLRNLREKIQTDKRETDELKKILTEAAQKKSQLTMETEKLMVKANTLKHIVDHLERTLRAGQSKTGASPDSSSP